MSRWRSIWLVARREILERGRSRGFILSVLFTTLIVVGSFVLPAVIFGGPDVAKIGVVQPAPPTLESTIKTIATGADRQIEFRPYPDLASARAALQSGDIAAVIDVPADLTGPGQVLYKEAPDQFLQSIVGSAVVAMRSQELLSAIDPAALAAVQKPPEAVALDPQSDADRARFLFANIGAVLVLVGIFSFGFTVLTGVVEEKQSRVVEVVLSTVRPRDLLMGKVLGIGILGLFQLAVFLLAAAIAARVTDRFVLPETTPTAIAMLAVWFILGYTLYSTALGFLGALASRMEEASNASTPVTMVAMLSYFVAIFAVLADPNGTVATVATFIPPMAPFVVPLRSAFDAIPAWQLVLSILLTLAFIYVLFTIGARVYAGAVLQTAGRIKLRDAWRSAGK